MNRYVPEGKPRAARRSRNRQLCEGVPDCLHVRDRLRLTNPSVARIPWLRVLTMMTDGDHYDLVRPFLIDQAVRKPPEQYPPLVNIERRSDLRKPLDQVSRVLNIPIEGSPEFDRLRRIIP